MCYCCYYNRQNLISKTNPYTDPGHQLCSRTYPGFLTENRNHIDLIIRDSWGLRRYSKKNKPRKLKKYATPRKYGCKQGGRTNWQFQNKGSGSETWVVVRRLRPAAWEEVATGKAEAKSGARVPIRSSDAARNRSTPSSGLNRLPWLFCISVLVKGRNIIFISSNFNVNIIYIYI